VCAFRPLPPYEGSCGPLPANDVGNDDLLKRYGITKPTLFKRRDALVEKGWVSPTKVGPRLYYSAQDVHLLDCCNYWSANGYTLPEIVAHLSNQEKAYKKSGKSEPDEDNAFDVGPANDGAIEVEAETTTTDLVVRGLQTSAKDLQLLGEEVVAKLARAVGEAVKQSIPRDALAGHDFLSKAADKGYLLTAKILAEGIGMKVSTIHGWPDESDRLGFRVSRVGKGQWKVRRLTNEEIEEAAAEEQRAVNSGWANVQRKGNAA